MKFIFYANREVKSKQCIISIYVHILNALVKLGVALGINPIELMANFLFHLFDLWYTHQKDIKPGMKFTRFISDVAESFVKVKELEDSVGNQN